MYNYIISKNKRSGNLELRYTSSPCFRIFTQRSASSAQVLRGFLDENELEYIIYPIGGNQLEAVLKGVVNGNPLFPQCRVLSGTQVKQVITGSNVSILQQNIGEGSNNDLNLERVVNEMRSAMFLVIQLKSEEYPLGLPINVVAQCLFTVRNISSASEYFSANIRTRYENNNIPLYFMYLDYCLFYRSASINPANSGSLSSTLTLNVESYESDSISRYSFGLNSYRMVQEFINNPETFPVHPLDDGRYFLTQRGYLRDSEFGDVRVYATQGSGALRKTMSDSMTLYRGKDIPLIGPYRHTQRYVAATINRLHGCFLFPAAVNNVDDDFEVGDVVFFRSQYLPSSIGLPRSAVLNYGKVYAQGSKIVEIDVTRPDSIKLDTGVYILPEALTKTGSVGTTPSNFVIYDNELHYITNSEFDGLYMVNMRKWAEWCSQNAVLPMRPSEEMEFLDVARTRGMPQSCKVSGIAPSQVTAVE